MGSSRSNQLSESVDTVDSDMQTILGEWWQLTVDGLYARYTGDRCTVRIHFVFMPARTNQDLIIIIYYFNIIVIIMWLVVFVHKNNMSNILYRNIVTLRLINYSHIINNNIILHNIGIYVKCP